VGRDARQCGTRHGAAKLPRLHAEPAAAATVTPALRGRARLAWWLLRLAGLLPLRLLHALGAAVASVSWWRGGRTRRVLRANLAIAQPQLDAAQRDALARACLRQAGRGVAELGKVWADGAQALLRVRAVEGQALFDAALASGRGLIVAAPHLGCWELLNHWIAARTPLAILYRPPRHAEWEPLLRRARGRYAPEQVRAESGGVRALYRRLAQGGVVGILPDQQPRAGEGVFAPFFGRPAATMVLLSRLAQRTGATVLFGYMERLPRGGGFRLHWRQAPQAVADADPERACAALNAAVEACVRDAFTQYQWTYKRWGVRPAGVDDPYAAR